jgi:type I restriction enzyme, S subunit
MQRYSAYKPSQIDWLGNIPSDWRVERIKMMDEIVMGQSPSGHNVFDEEKGIPFLQGNTEFGSIIPENKYWTIEITKEAKPNDLLLSVRASIGELNFADQIYVIGRGLCAIHSIKSEIKFIYYCLLGLKDYYKSIATGTTFFAINIVDIKDTKLAYPTRTEQKAIAQYLDKATEDIDKIISIKRLQLEKLEQYKQAEIHKAVTRGLDKNAKPKESGIEWIGEIPEHWKVERIKDVVELRTEKTTNKSEEKDYLELEDIEQGTGKIVGFRDTLEVSSDVTIFRKNDVLFGKLRPYLAKYWLADRDGKCTGEIIAFNCQKIESTFFIYFIGSPKFIEICTAVAYGAKMPRVDWTRQIAYFYIAFPDKREQKEIANYLEQFCANVQNEKYIIEKQIEKLQQYRKSLIHECVTGKRKVIE